MEEGGVRGKLTHNAGYGPFAMNQEINLKIGPIIANFFKKSIIIY
jgi:hypothetical protein